MEKLSTIVYGVITLVVVVLLIFTIAIPVIEDSQNAQTIETNNEGFSYKVLSSTSSQSLEFTQTNNVISINDDDVTLTDPFYPVAIGKNYLLMAGALDSSAMIEVVLGGARVTNVSKVVWSAGDITYTVSGVDTTVSDVGDIYYLTSSTSNLALFRMSLTEDIGYNSDSAPLIFGLKADHPSVSFTCTINDNGEISYYNVPTAYSGSVTVSSYTGTVDSEKTEYGRIIHDFDMSLTFSDSSTYDMNDSQLYVIAPVKYTAVDEGSMIYILLGIIPLILAIIPIMMAVQFINGNRRD